MFYLRPRWRGAWPAGEDGEQGLKFQPSQLVQGVPDQFSLTVGEGRGVMREVGVWGGRGGLTPGRRGFRSHGQCEQRGVMLAADKGH